MARILTITLLLGVLILLITFYEEGNRIARARVDCLVSADNTYIHSQEYERSNYAYWQYSYERCLAREGAN